MSRSKNNPDSRGSVKVKPTEFLALGAYLLGMVVMSDVRGWMEAAIKHYNEKSARISELEKENANLLKAYDSALEDSKKVNVLLGDKALAMLHLEEELNKLKDAVAFFTPQEKTT